MQCNVINIRSIPGKLYGQSRWSYIYMHSIIYVKSIAARPFYQRPLLPAHLSCPVGSLEIL